MKISFVLVLGAWGSGTTAIAGALNALGAYTCPPYFNTNDIRTPCAYEPLYLRQILLKHIDEQNIVFKGDYTVMLNELRDWLNITIYTHKLDNKVVVIKHPLLIMALPYLHTLLNPRYIVVKRSLNDIENTRARRHWPPVYGSDGARRIYSMIDMALAKLPKTNVLTIQYADFINCKSQSYLKKLARFCKLSPTVNQIICARQFIKR